MHRAQLGVTVQGRHADLAASLGLEDVRGALVSAVDEGQPGRDRAGLQRGDVIVGLDGQPVDDGNALRNRVASARPGSSVTLGVVRDGREETLRAQLEERRVAESKEGRSEAAEGGGRLGLAVRPVTPEEADELHLDSKQGLLVSDVDPSGPAADAGLRPGDVIEQVNRRPVADVGALKAAVIRLRREAGAPAGQPRRPGRLPDGRPAAGVRAVRGRPGAE